MKKLNLIIISILLTLTLAACGSPSGPSAPEAAPSGASPTPEQIPAAETPAPDSDIADAGPADTTPAASSPDGEFSNPSLTDSQKEFCEKIIAAVKSKDLQALSDLCNYPLYVDLGEEGQVVETKEAFLALDPEKLFTDAMVASVTGCDLDTVTVPLSGITLCTDYDQPSITSSYNEAGELGISGINF